MDEKLQIIKRSWDLSAATDNRMKAVHYVIKGRPMDESVYDGIYEHLHLNLRFKANDTVLEIGAGSGLLLERIARNVKTVFGTDISRDILRLSVPQDHLFVQQMDSGALAFRNETFDKVICNSMVQYLPDLTYLQRYFAEMVRVCKPGGLVFLGDLFNAYLRESWIDCHRSTGLKIRLLGGLNRLRGRKEQEYLFVDPHQLFQWSKMLGCQDFKALLQLSPAKPLLHRMFRYDAIISR